MKGNAALFVLITSLISLNACTSANSPSAPDIEVSSSISAQDESSPVPLAEKTDVISENAPPQELRRSTLIPDELLVEFDEHFYVLLDLMGGDCTKPSSWNFNKVPKGELPVALSKEALAEYSRLANELAQTLSNHQATIIKVMPKASDFQEQIGPMLKQFSLENSINEAVRNENKGAAQEAFQEWQRIERERIPIMAFSVIKLAQASQRDPLQAALEKSPLIRKVTPHEKMIIDLQQDFKKNEEEEINQILHAKKTDKEPLTVLEPQAWGIGATGANILWQKSLGEGQVIAIMDSGVDTDHPDLKNNIWVNHREIPNNGIDDDKNNYVDDANGYDFSEKFYCYFPHPNKYYDPDGCRKDSASPYRKKKNPDLIDRLGHGTWVAGVAAANPDEAGYRGIAPKAKVMVIKVLDYHYNGKEWMDYNYNTSFNLLSAFKYAADNGATVVNASFQSTAADQYRTARGAFSKALDYLAKKKVVVVASHGNLEINDDFSLDYIVPGDLPQTIRVGCISHYKDVPRFDPICTHGFFMDVVSAAYVISPVSRFITGIKDQHQRDEHVYYSERFFPLPRRPIVNNDLYYHVVGGSSISTPHISGLAALLKSIFKGIDNEEVRQLLRYYTFQKTGRAPSEPWDTSGYETGILQYLSGSGFTTFRSLPDKDFLPKIALYDNEGFAVGKPTECALSSFVDVTGRGYMTSQMLTKMNVKIAQNNRGLICGTISQKDILSWKASLLEFDPSKLVGWTLDLKYLDPTVFSWRTIGNGNNPVTNGHIATIPDDVLIPTILRIEVENKKRQKFNWTQKLDLETFESEMSGRLPFSVNPTTQYITNINLEIEVGGTRLKAYELVWFPLEPKFIDRNRLLATDNGYWYFGYDTLSDKTNYEEVKLNPGQMLNKTLTIDGAKLGMTKGDWMLYLALHRDDGKKILIDRNIMTLR